jgi:ankyrin repeat protein
MYKAINDGNIEELDRLVTVNRTLLNTLLNETDCSLPIHYAASIGNTKVVEWIIKQDTGLIDRKDVVGRTPLYHAAQNNHCDTVEKLIRLGSALDILDTYRFSPLHIAASRGHSTMVELLVRLGSRMMDTQCEYYWNNPMILAIKNGHINVVRMLIKLGSCEWNQSNIDGIQLIHVAAMHGHTQIVELLVEKGVPIDVVTTYGITPLHYAAMCKHLDVIKLLVRLNSSALDQQSAKQGTTPIMMAISRGTEKRSVETIELLLRLGSKSIDTGNMHFSHPIVAAISRNDAMIVECLIANGSQFFNMVDQPAYKRALEIGWRCTAFQTLLALGYDQEMYRRWCEQEGFKPLIVDEETAIDIRWRVYFRKPLVHRLLDI